MKTEEKKINRLFNGKMTNRPRTRICRRKLLASAFLLFLFVFFSTIVFQSIVLQNALQRAISTTTTPPLPPIDLPSISAHDDSIYYLYIDVGCFNGETVEHFLHFTANSSIYNIITFEADPTNFRLCRSTLAQRKYSHLKIFLLRHVVWIRRETIGFRTGLQSQSRIDANRTDSHSEEIEAIDFSSWLLALTRGKKTRIQMKISAPGAEVFVLEKMAADETLALAHNYQIEWSDRDDPRVRGRRIFLQLLFDSLGYDPLFYTRLDDVRDAFQRNQPWSNVTKFYDWRLLNASDTFTHYVERPDRK